MGRRAVTVMVSKSEDCKMVNYAASGTVHRFIICCYAYTRLIKFQKH